MSAIPVSRRLVTTVVAVAAVAGDDHYGAVVLEKLVVVHRVVLVEDHVRRIGVRECE